MTSNAVKNFADDILANHMRLDILINNAGVFQQDKIITQENLESTFAINVAAPFILFCKLLPLIKATPCSRIINVSSISQGDFGRIDLSNLQFEKGGFSSYDSYSLSKLCIAALSHELAQRISPDDALVMSCDPGTVNTKMLAAGWGSCGVEVQNANHEYNLAIVPLRFNGDQGGGRDYDEKGGDSSSSSTSGAGYSSGKVWTATASADCNGRDVERGHLEQLGTASAAHGQYFVGGKIVRCCSDVYNDELRCGLWDYCERITGVRL